MNILGIETSCDETSASIITDGQLISNVISTGTNKGIEVSVCGEMASDSIASIILYSLGLRVFSLSPSSAALIFHTLSDSKFIKNKTPLNIDDFAHADEIREYVNENN